MENSEKPHIAKAEMMIRRPLQEVFEAFIQPETTTKFWFTHSSGKLEPGKSIIWKWEMYDLQVPVTVLAVEPHSRILIEWGEGKHLSSVEWAFKTLAGDKTFVSITNFGFQLTGEDLINTVLDSTGGFTMVIAGLKAWLEHGIELNLIGDKAPPEIRNA